MRLLREYLSDLAMIAAMPFLGVGAALMWVAMKLKPDPVPEPPLPKITDHSGRPPGMPSAEFLRLHDAITLDSAKCGPYFELIRIWDASPRWAAAPMFWEAEYECAQHHRHTTGICSDFTIANA